MSERLQAEETSEAGLVLVVDDEARNRRLLKDLLEAAGHRVIMAVDGVEALDAVAVTHPDVLLLDIMMPRLDGLEVCRRLKQAPATAHIPILLVTALTELDARVQGMEAGADDFISKPVDRLELMLRVRNAVRTKRLFDELQARYDQLRQMQDLRDNLTQMLISDNEALAAILGVPGPGADPASGDPARGVPPHTSITGA